MAKKKQEDPPKGAPAWMSTFSDLMNLLLCFFVLLFSMSSVDAEKMEMLIQSFQNTFSVLPAGGTTVSQQGTLISSGVSALEQFDVYFNASTANMGNEENEGNNADSDTTKTGETGQQEGIADGSEADLEKNDEENRKGEDLTEEELQGEVEKRGIEESEKIKEDVENQLLKMGIQDQVELNFNGQYVLLTLNGALLFDSGKAEVKEQALPLVEKLAGILQSYEANVIQIEGHTDNVPINSSKYESNDVLSMYRALYVADYIRSITNIEPSHIVSAGRGSYFPVADNATAEGRALNRRVEIKIFNSYNSSEIQE